MTRTVSESIERSGESRAMRDDLKEVIAAGAAPAWVHSGDGVIVAANEAADSLYGYAPGALTGLNVEALLIGESVREVLFHPTPPYVFVNCGRHRRADGSTFDADCSVTAVAEGRFVVAVADATERRAIEDAVRDSERQLAEAQRIAHFGSFEWDMNTNRVRWSDELYRIYGVEPREFAASYEAFLARIHPHDLEHVNRTILNSAHTGEPFAIEERVLRRDGSVRHLRSRGHVVNENGRRRLVGVCHDVTELRAAEQERFRAENRERQASLRAQVSLQTISEVLERVTDAFVALDSEWKYTYVNRKAAEIFVRDDLVGRHIWTEFPEGVGQPFHRAYERAMATQQVETLEEYYPPYDRWFENRIYPSPRGLTIYFQDVTERRRKAEELALAREQMERTESFALVMSVHIGLDGKIIKAPPTFLHLAGAGEGDRDLVWDDLTIEDDRERDRHAYQRIIRGETRASEIDKRIGRAETGVAWVSVNYAGVYDAGDKLMRLVAYVRDITDRHAMEQQLRHQALHDGLTGLPNRTLFADRLQHAIDGAFRRSESVAVLLVELDAFHVVNDSHGHSFGDALLREVADRLRSVIVDADTLARLGGDEFAVILEERGDSSVAGTVAEKVRAALAERFTVGGEAVHVTASIGISRFPRDGADAESLLQNADNAVYRAKEMGRNNIQAFTRSMSERFHGRLSREDELHTAVERAQFVNHYQPVLRRSDRSIVGVEALVRWNHPARGLVRPEEFISLAEETGIIVPIGAMVLRSACVDVQAWRSGESAKLRLSVNLSVRQFQQSDLLETIDSILAGTGVDPTCLELEITESVAMKNVDYTMHVLRELRARGIAIAIDDFGTGHSSLIYLRHFPISTIKIDRMFIAGLPSSTADTAIVRAVVNLGRDLGLSTTAEGVETEAQLEALDALGVDQVQGYLFSRPVGAGDMASVLAAGGDVRNATHR